MNRALAEALKTASDLSTGLSTSLTGPGKVVAEVAGLALGAAAGFAAAGDDPVIQIRRLLSSSPGVQKVEDSWKDALDRKFGPKG